MMQLTTLYATKDDLPDPTPYGFSLDDINYIPQEGTIKINRVFKDMEDYEKWFSGYMRELQDDIMMRLNKMENK